jgi:hypothetical protein
MAKVVDELGELFVAVIWVWLQGFSQCFIDPYRDVAFIRIEIGVLKFNQ